MRAGDRVARPRAVGALRGGGGGGVVLTASEGGAAESGCVGKARVEVEVLEEADVTHTIHALPPVSPTHPFLKSSGWSTSSRICRPLVPCSSISSFTTETKKMHTTHSVSLSAHCTDGPSTKSFPHPPRHFRFQGSTGATKTAAMARAPGRGTLSPSTTPRVRNVLSPA